MALSSSSSMKPGATWRMSVLASAAAEFRVELVRQRWSVEGFLLDVHGSDDDERGDPARLALALLTLVGPVCGPGDHAVQQKHVGGDALRDDWIDRAVLAGGVAHRACDL